MSKPRYSWWGYIKAIIRQYPAIMDVEVSGAAQREKEAVRAAIEATMGLEDGAERMQVIDMVFWRRTHTLEGAAMRVHVSDRTARRWHSEFILLVGKLRGMVD